jgi:hypothetical protein
VANPKQRYEKELDYKLATDLIEMLIKKLGLSPTEAKEMALLAHVHSTGNFKREKVYNI